jgi:predicted RNase H-like HicB family nuclease
MRRLVSKIAVVGLSVGFAFAVTACKEEGAMEKAGKAADEAVEQLKDVGQGTMEKAGETADEAVEKAKEAVEGEK